VLFLSPADQRFTGTTAQGPSAAVALQLAPALGILKVSMVAAILRQVAGGASRTQQESTLIAAFRRQVERALQEGRWRFADHFCDKILAEDPRNIETWLLKGHLAWHRFRDARTAIECYRQVLVLGGYDSARAEVGEARRAIAELAERYS